jgi:uncharacterized protein YjbJ (UPF0337 family)
MGAENKAANKVTEVRGRIKKKAGQATDDTGLEAVLAPRDDDVSADFQ